MAYRVEFGQAVRKAIGKMTYREIARAGGPSPAYVADMVQGRVPRREPLEALAAATGASLNELLEAAGLPPISEGYNGGGHFLLGLRRLAAQLAAECGEERAASLVGSIRFAQFPGPDTPIEHVEQALRDLETDIREELGAR